MEKILVSTVTPVYNGELYLRKLVLALKNVKQEWENNCYPFELVESIFIVDNAIDNSSVILEEISEDISWIQVLTLSRNYGQHPATIAGILHSTGDWVITLDEDLQHNPKYFINILEKAILEELDVVYANPKSSVHKKLYRDLGSILYKYIIAKISNNPVISKFNSYRLIRGSIGRGAASVCSHETYFDIALCWFTGRIGTVPLLLEDNRYTTNNKSGYNIRKLISHARRLIISSQTKILRIGALFGSLSMVACVIFAAKILLQKIFTPEKIPVQGWTSIMLIIVFFGGLTSFLLGIIIEYISNILLHMQGKPAFFIVDRRKDSIAINFFNKRDDPNKIN